MKNAKASDWKTEPLPDKHTVVRFSLSYAGKDRQKILKGIIPGQMEDKWFLFYDQGVLSFHRSWTGYCIYRVHADDNGCELNFTHAEVNRDPEQYSETDDDADRKMIPYLINTLLLRRPAQFPSGTGQDEDALATWSSVGRASLPVLPEEDTSTDFIRIIPAQRFTGLPAPPHRPYAFYTDAASLQGKSVSESYSLVKGLSPPLAEFGRKHSSPFLWWNDRRDLDAPLARLKIKKNIVQFEETALKLAATEKFVVLRVSRADALRYLDAFPATWKALSYIVSDPVRMKARELGWDIRPDQYASARIHALFCKVQDDGEAGLLAANKSKKDLGLCDLDRLPAADEERDYYAYLSKESSFTDQIVELFGISSRCWHGCGYIGSPGNPVCRIFLLQNQLSPRIKISIMRSKEIIE